jgi:hypothetical protein
MLTPICNIIINEKLKFKGCRRFSIEADVNNLSVTGKLEMPLMAVMKLGDEKRRIRLGEEIKPGMKIEPKIRK